MTAKIVTEYLSKRASGQKGLRSPKLKFTLAQIKALPIADFDYEARDTEQKGFICRVRSSGVKSLEIYKKPKGSQKPVRVSICQLGTLPWKDSNPSHDSIESEVYRILAQLRNGTNPNETARISKLRKEATEVKLEAAMNNYLGSADIKDSTRKGYESIIKNHFKDDLKSCLTVLLDKSGINAHHSRITKASGPIAANNAMRVLRAISNFTREETEDEAGFSPIPEWPIKHRQQSKRFWNKETRRTGWIKPEHLKDWWEATEKLPNDYLGDGELARDYLQFVLLSGMRRREATSLEWADIDFKSKSFKVPDTKNNTALELPLSEHMMKILVRRQRLGGYGPFTIEEPKKFVAWVRKESGVNFTIHDLRRSFMTYAEMLDLGHYTIKALVNHSTAPSRDVTAGYIQLSIERLRKPMQKISRYVLSQTNQKNLAKLQQL